MSTDGNDRYSLDFDSEFEEMLSKFKSAKFHSSLIEDSDHDGDATHKLGNLLSPSFSPIKLMDSPEEKHLTDRKMQSHVHARRRSSPHKQIMRVDNIVIELSDEDSSSDEVCGNEDLDSIDLNATYTDKTMGSRRLSRMLDVLKEIEMEEVLDQGIANSELPQRPVHEFLSPRTPSPFTPYNRNKPLPMRSYRLLSVNECVQSPCSRPKSNSKKRPHESNIINSSLN